MKAKVKIIAAVVAGLMMGLPLSSYSANPDYRIIAGSDGFSEYKETFLRAAMELIESGRCTEEDFIEMSGWAKSINHKSKPIYFTYCGGFHVDNRIYMNAETGKVLE